MDNLTLQKATYKNIKDILVFPNHEIKVVEILRFLPKKRVVFKAIWHEKDVVVKLFFNKDRKKRDQEYQKEIDTIKILNNLKLDTPELLDYKKLYYRDYNYIITKYLINDIKNKDINNSLDIEKNINIYYKAIASLHNHGIYQEDIHANNFIKSNDNIYYIDVSQINLKYYHQKINPKVALDNLALFVCQFTKETQDKLIAKLDAYFENITYLKEDQVKQHINKYKKYIIKKAAKFFKHRLKDYKQKLLRNCSDFICCKSSNINNSKIKGMFKRSEYYKNQDFFDKFIYNPDAYKENITKYFKKGNTAQVYLIDSGVCKLVVKFYKNKSILHSMKNSFLKTRALKSWISSNIFNFLGVHTIDPIGYFELRKYGLFQGAYFITKYDESLDDLNKVLEKSSKIKINAVANNIVNNLKLLKKNKVYHGDFKIYNILANANKLSDSFFIIDLEQAKHVSNERYFNYLHNKDCTRMLKSLDNYKDIKNLVIEKIKINKN